MKDIRGQVVLVDEQDQEIGFAEKLEAHKKGFLHRAFSIFVFDKSGKVLLQRRVKHKYHSGGLWANTCCSHPQRGESLYLAVHRRLKEEMGFDCDLKKVFAFSYKENFSNDLIEHEYDHVFVGVYDGKVFPNEKEVDEYRWILWDDLIDDVKENPNNYVAWLKIILEKRRDLNSCV